MEALWPAAVSSHNDPPGGRQPTTKQGKRARTRTQACMAMETSAVAWRCRGDGNGCQIQNRQRSARICHRPWAARITVPRKSGAPQPMYVRVRRRQTELAQPPAPPSRASVRTRPSPLKWTRTWWLECAKHPISRESRTCMSDRSISGGAEYLGIFIFSDLIETKSCGDHWCVSMNRQEQTLTKRHTIKTCLLSEYSVYIENLCVYINLHGKGTKLSFRMDWKAQHTLVDAFF